MVGDPKYYQRLPWHDHMRFAARQRRRQPHDKEHNPKKALQLFKEAGYNGEPIVILATTDHNTITPATQVLIQAMRDAGLNVDAQAMDWGTTVTRRAKKEPPAQGGWNIFVTTTGGISSSNPILHTWIGAACDKGLFGWPCSKEIEDIRNSYGFAQSLDEKKKIAKDLQALAMEEVAYVPFGQWNQLVGIPGRSHHAVRAEHGSDRALEHREKVKVAAVLSTIRSE